MDRSGSDREVMSLVGFILAVVAMVVASIALVVAVAGRDTSGGSNAAQAPVQNVSAPGNLSSSMDVTLQEYSMVTSLDTVKAGKIKFTIHNVGTMTHEMVLVRAASVTALPTVAIAGGERAVGDVDEEAIPEADLPGEATVKKGKTVAKTIALTPGTYVMLCNIDGKMADGTVLNHFQEGMHAVFTVS